MHIVYIVTSVAGQKCGVVDYTRQLALSVGDVVAKVTIEELPIWSFTELLRLKRKYKDEQEIIFHLQYPTMGMGKSFAPALLNLFLKNKKVFITFHEFEQFNLLRKSYFLITSFLNTSYVFTNEHEKKHFLHYFPWTKKKCQIIPIGNNITPVPYEPQNDDDKHRLIYFGQIAPNKGIEQYLETVSSIRACGIDIPCAIIGATLGNSFELLQKIKLSANKYNIECLFNLTSEEVSKELHESSIAYLPFLGGVSDKRGSALACLAHGLKLITIHSGLTPKWWRETTYNAITVEDAKTIIKRVTLKEQDQKKAKAIDKKIVVALQEREWKHIAEKHLVMYKGLAL